VQCPFGPRLAQSILKTYVAIDVRAPGVGVVGLQAQRLYENIQAKLETERNDPRRRIAMATEFFNLL
jgi:hypothetical protein